MKEKDTSIRGQVRSAMFFMAHRDPNTGEVLVMGRNKNSWAKITAFFLVFYGCLACFFAAMLAAFYTTVPSREEGPKLIQYLEDKPGVNSYPMEIGEAYDPNDSSSYDNYVSSINNILQAYKDARGSADFSGIDCDRSTGTTREKGSKMCLFDPAWLGDCDGNTDKSYGYKNGKPCILLRMNKIFSWIPKPEDNEVLVNVTCTGGPVTITPNGFYVSFFPFMSEKHYLGPLVAIQLQDSSSHTLECKVIGKNIEHSETFRRSKGAYGQLLIEVAGASS